MSADTAIILAGGKGSRMRGAVRDKVLEPLCGLPVIMHSFKAFAESGAVCGVVFVCRDAAQQKAIDALVKKHFPKTQLRVDFARGGAERQDSVLNGLKKASQKRVAENSLVFIHDGARPFVGAENIKRLSEAATSDGAAVLAARVVDTIKRIPANKRDTRLCKLADMDRKRLWAMQTPQVFGLWDILRAYEKIKASGGRITDDVAAATACGIRVSIVENFSSNMKITVPDDIALAQYLITKGKK